jgi:hypothetical protein
VIHNENGTLEDLGNDKRDQEEHDYYDEEIMA